MAIDTTTRFTHGELSKTGRAAVTLMGRALYSAIFILAAPTHFSKATIDMASAQGVPFAAIAVPASGLLALVGGLSILFGWRARLGAWAIVLFLVPATLMMHRFWLAPDAEAMKVQLTMFLKNLSLIGGALLITQLGAGSMSLDERTGA